jgi:SulP family sulfate permease
MVRCFPTFLGMYLVVAFGSSLDVAAIQMDLGKPLDFNRELMVVGASNALSGMYHDTCDTNQPSHIQRN